MSPWRVYHAKVSFLPPNHEDWVTLTGPFQLLAVLNHSCPSSLSSDIMSPNGHIDDGLMDLLAVFSGGRVKMIKLLMGMRRSGEHVKQENCVYQKVKAVIIEPETTNWFNIDGEPYECHRLQVDLMPHKVTYFGQVE